MAEFETESKKKTLKVQLRKEAMEIYRIVKQRMTEDTNGSKNQSKTNLAELENCVDLTDKERVLEKFQCLATDNCKLRENITCLRYQLENLKDQLDETQHRLVSTQHSERKKLDELAYLRHLSKNQADEIKALTETVEQLRKHLVENGLKDCLISPPTATPKSPTSPVSLPSDRSQSSPVNVTNEGSREPSWLQSMQNVFRKVKIDFTPHSESTPQSIE